MGLKNKLKANKWPIIIGTGLALYPIHNLWLTEITSIGDRATLFLPAMGAVLWIMGSLFYIRDNWKTLDLGDKRIYIPLLVIVASIGLSGFINGETIGDKIVPLLIGVCFFSTYVVSRRLGVDIFRMLIPFVCLGAVISLIIGVLNPGISYGGMITNYCAAAGFLIFGALVNQGKWQWALILIALIGVFFIGALEGAFIIGIIGITVLIRRDYNKYLLMILSVLIIFAFILAVNGALIPLYTGNNNLVVFYEVVTGKSPINMETMNIMTSHRWEVYVEAIDRFNFIGHGFSLDLMKGRNIHNVPLNIMDQIGILGAIAWLGLSLYCAIKTKWHYAWIAILAMSVWDHYIWTQFGPLWFCLIGVSTASTIKTDLIFKK